MLQALTGTGLEGSSVCMERILLRSCPSRLLETEYALIARITSVKNQFSPVLERRKLGNMPCVSQCEGLVLLLFKKVSQGNQLKLISSFTV